MHYFFVNKRSGHIFREWKIDVFFLVIQFQHISVFITFLYF